MESNGLLLFSSLALPPTFVAAVLATALFSGVRFTAVPSRPNCYCNSSFLCWSWCKIHCHSVVCHPSPHLLPQDLTANWNKRPLLLLEPLVLSWVLITWRFCSAVPFCVLSISSVSPFICVFQKLSSGPCSEQNGVRGCWTPQVTWPPPDCRRTCWFHAYTRLLWTCLQLLDVELCSIDDHYGDVCGLLQRYVFPVSKNSWLPAFAAVMELLIIRF